MKKVVLTDLSLKVEKVSDIENSNTKGGATNPNSCLALGCTGSGHWICPTNRRCEASVYEGTQFVCC